MQAKTFGKNFKLKLKNFDLKPTLLKLRIISKTINKILK